MAKEQLILCRNISGAKTSTVLEVEPGAQYQITDIIEHAISPSDLKAPPYAICYMRRLANGDYRPEPVEWSDWVPLSDGTKLGAMGIKISRQNLFRLCSNGYVQLRRISPHVIEVNIASLVDHLRKVQGDPEFWDRQADDGSLETRRQAYLRKANW